MKGEFLTIDAGNRRVKYGLFNNSGDLLWYLHKEGSPDPTHLPPDLRECLTGVIGSTVSTPFDASLWQTYFPEFIELTERTPIPIKNQYVYPGSLGKDRLAAGMGAYFGMNGESALVIDAGTCITIDRISKTLGFEGGSISPGIQMRLDAMHHFTARLPAIPFQAANQWPATNTEAAMLEGVQKGIVYELNGYIHDFLWKDPKGSVFLTGGDAPIFESLLKYRIFADPHLVLRGLYKILLYNVLA